MKPCCCNKIKTHVCGAMNIINKVAAIWSAKTDMELLEQIQQLQQLDEMKNDTR